MTACADGLSSDAQRSVAEAYFVAGWSPIPLPAGQKSPPLDGWTGWDAPRPELAQVRRWWAAGAFGNIGLRMPDGVIGIDVDDYGPKRGGRTLTLLEGQYGALPPTFTSTSRADQVSGIRFFTVPQPGRWRGVLSAQDSDGSTTKDVDVIQAGHRYAVTWPSTHPEGRTYRWLAPDGSQFDAVPSVEALPALSDAWLEHLARRTAARRYRKGVALASPTAVSPDLAERGRRAARDGSGRAARERAGLTVLDMAGALGISTTRAAHLELGRKRPRDHLAADYQLWLDRSTTMK